MSSTHEHSLMRRGSPRKSSQKNSRPGLTALELVLAGGVVLVVVGVSAALLIGIGKEEQPVENTGRLRDPAPSAPQSTFTPPKTEPAKPDVKSFVGEKAKQWELSEWANSEPLTVAGLAGKVILVRWWTAPTCRYCQASAPALREFHERFKDQGLVVVGIYHHKQTWPATLKEVKERARNYGFEFPIAIDPLIESSKKTREWEWVNLNKWWPKERNRTFTSVSFLIDRKGVIRHVHRGGIYAKGDADYTALLAKIEELLKEKP